MEEKNTNKEVTTFGNISKDSSLPLQPKGSTRFALNAVNETNEGDLGMLSTEEGNAISHTFPPSFIPIGSVSINNNSSLVFLTDNINSILAIIKEGKDVEIIFDDTNQEDKLDFKISNQIDATYRLRKGCERTVYWVDPVPRFFILDRPDKFKKENGEWNINSFNLFRKIEKIPKFKNIVVNSSGGSLLSGSYIVSVQYLDNDFNSTEFINSSQTLKIYRDPITFSFRDIRGSSSKEESFYSPESTNKSFTIELSNLDTENYPFYRLAISEINKGSGLISEVKYTSEIPTSINRFTYTGNNFDRIGTQEEVAISNLIINKANHIDQLDNQLLLSSTKGLEAQLCNLQKYASKIQVDCQTKKVNLNLISESNPKSPTVSFEGLGYMPGEIYSLGIVYILEDNVFTPVYHIPGKSPVLSDEATFTSGNNIYPMSTENENLDSVYTDNSSCNDRSYWGLDSQGNSLKNKKIRHHRFPLRSDIGLNLVEKQDFEGQNIETSQLKIEMFGQLIIPDCPEGEVDCESFTLENTPDIVYEITYAFADIQGNPIQGTETVLVDNISYLDWDNGSEDDNPPVPGLLKYSPSEVSEYGLVPISIKETVTYPNGNVSSNPPLMFSSNSVVSSETGITYTINSILSNYNSEGSSYFTDILGLKFSNIEIPNPEDIGGKKVIGYFFVRNPREEEDKTILDTGIVGPSLENKDFISFSHLMPEIDLDTQDRINKKNMYFINPEFKFRGKQNTDFSSVIKQGEYVIEERLKSRVIVEDVLDGTSYDSKRHRRSEKDDDGWQLHVKTRQNKVGYVKTNTKEVLNISNIRKVKYLNVLEESNIEEENSQVLNYWNLSGDNKIGLLESSENYPEDFIEKIDYVVFKRENLNPYSNFRSTSYIKISNNFYEAGEPLTKEQRTEFGGDTYVSPMSIVNSFFWDSLPRRRRTKGGFFRQFLGAILIAAAVFVAVGSLGLATPLAVALGSAGIAIGATIALSGVQQTSYNKAYRKLWKEGLRDTILDNFVKSFKDINPKDDEIQWVGEMTTIFFESSVNCYLRHGVNKTSDTDFINAPALYESGNNHVGINKVDSKTKLDAYMVEKLTYFEPEKNDSREYLGISLPEVYTINEDFLAENIQKVYEHLPIEYDCCSDCLEDFPHRIHHSLQSFEEELTDNFQVFLPNNYKDIQGNTGIIKDIFTIRNSLYVVTEHALWHLPQNFQERITDSIVSFIGTGEYFATPPRKIVDDEINSAGTSFKWGIIKTKHGVLIISDRENKIYFFNGENLEPISDFGLSSYFRENIESKFNEYYFKANNKNYPHLDNPSNPIGIGFISTYDTKKDRLIITKKDNVPTNLPEEDFIICQGNEGTILFENVSQIIAQKELEGYTYIGLENCRMKFEKEILETIPQENLDWRPIDPICEVAINQPSCNDSLSTSGGPGYYETEIELGVDTGETIITFNAIRVPDRFIIIYDNQIVADSLFVGDDLPDQFRINEILNTTTLNKFIYNPLIPSFEPNGTINVNYTLSDIAVSDGSEIRANGSGTNQIGVVEDSPFPESLASDGDVKLRFNKNSSEITKATVVCIGVSTSTVWNIVNIQCPSSVPVGTLDIDIKSYSTDYTADQFNITLQSSQNWSATTPNSSWISFSPISGGATQSTIIQVSLLQNEGVGRLGQIIFTDTLGNLVTCTIEQLANNDNGQTQT